MKPILCFSFLTLALPALAQDSDLRLASPRPSLAVGEAIQVRASLEASILVTPLIEFSSTNPVIATVDSDGVVRGMFPGVVAIQANERTTNAQTQILLKIVPARIDVTSAGADLRAGETGRLSARAFDFLDRPIDAAAFRFSSAQPAVATVAADGTIKAVAEGVVTVLAQMEGTPETIGFYSTLQLRIGPPREYAWRRMVATDPPTGPSTISAFTGLTGSGDVVGGLLTVSNGGQAAAVREANGLLRVTTYAGQVLPNIRQIVVRIPAVSVNSRGDMLAAIQYSETGCPFGIVLFPRNSPEVELAVGCNPNLSRHSMADDGSAFYFQDDSRGRHLRKRLPDGTVLTLLETASPDAGPAALRNLNDFFVLRTGAAVIARGTTNAGVGVSYWVTDKASKLIYSLGDSVDGRTILSHDEMHGGTDGVFYGRCNGSNFAAICRATADGFRLMLVTNVDTSNGLRLGWVHAVWDGDKGKVAFSGDWQVGDKYGTHFGLLDGSAVSLLRDLPAWNSTPFAQFSASGAVWCKIVESEDLLTTIRPGAPGSTLMGKQVPAPVAVPAAIDLTNTFRSAGGSSFLAIGAGEQILSVTPGGVRELLSPTAELPDGSRFFTLAMFAANRTGQAVFSALVPGAGGIYKYADGKFTTLLSDKGKLTAPDGTRFSYTNWWDRNSRIAINAAGDVVTYATFGSSETMSFLPANASQLKVILTLRAPLPLGFALANIGQMAMDDLGRVLFRADILNGPSALFFWDGQTIKELARIGAVVDGRTLTGIGSLAAGPKGFAILTTNSTAWRLHTFDGQSLTTLANGDQPVPGFSKSWGNLNNGLSVAGNGDVLVFGSSQDGAGVFVIRPSGSSASVLRAGDSLPDGALVLQVIGLFTGPTGEVYVAAHVLESGREKLATYQATPLR